MSASDPYFRFPLSALAYGKSPSEALDVIICYSVVSAGIGARQTDEDAFAALAAKNSLSGEPDEDAEFDSYEVICAGASLTNVTVKDWRSTYRCYQALVEHSRLFPKSALVTIKAKWVWDTLNTALEEEEKPARNETHGWMTWREFRVLCAVLSVIGKKSFAWASTATLLHRVCGFTAAASMQGRQTAPHCPPLTRWMLESTLDRLEELRYYLRVRISKSPTGRGGRTAYSIRHADRAALVTELRTPKFARASDNRKADHALWMQSV